MNAQNCESARPALSLTLTRQSPACDSIGSLWLWARSEGRCMCVGGMRPAVLGAGTVHPQGRQRRHPPGRTAAPSRRPALSSLRGRARRGEAGSNAPVVIQRRVVGRPVVGVPLVAHCWRHSPGALPAHVPPLPTVVARRPAGQCRIDSAVRRYTSPHPPAATDFWWQGALLYPESLPDQEGQPKSSEGSSFNRQARSPGYMRHGRGSLDGCCSHRIRMQSG